MSSSEQATTPTAQLPAAVPPVEEPAGQVVGEPAKPKQRRIKTVIVAAAAGLVLAIGGAAVANAVTTTNTTATTTQNGAAPGGAMDRPGGQAGAGAGRGAAAGLAGALHGDFVASDGNGGYVTKRLQSGTVTAVSDTSITAKSADGHSTTYTIDSSTSVNNGNNQVGDIKTGDTVTIVGRVSGGTATATTISDTTLNRAGGNQNGGPPTS
jgi:hypothetical protein